MTDRPDIDAIEARARKASPGPWRTDLMKNAGDNWMLCFGADDDGQGNVIVTTDNIRASGMLSGSSREDADFTAHSRSDIPALCGYIRHLEKAND